MKVFFISISLFTLTLILPNQIRAVSSQVSFLYDGEGNRVAKIEEGKTTLYVGDTEISLDSSQSLGNTQRYYSLGSKRVAAKNTDTNSQLPITNYLVSDHLGSTRLLTDTTGTLIPDSSTSYYPYGASRTSQSPGLSRTYTGQINDQSTGLYFYNARYYNPITANFISADTKANEFNRYSYVYGNPIKLIDPSGRSADDYPYYDSYRDPVFASIVNQWTGYLNDYKRDYGEDVDRIDATNLLVNLIHRQIQYSSSLDMIMQDLDVIQANIDNFSKSDKPEDQNSLKIWTDTKTRALKDKKMWFLEYYQKDMSTQYKEDMFICQSFVQMTADLLYDYLGINAVPLGSTDINHAFVGIEINNKPYIIDPTNGIGVTSLEESRAKNKFGQLSVLSDNGYPGFPTKRGGGNIINMFSQ